MLVTEPDAEFLIVFIKEKELHLKQGEDSSCQNIVFCFNRRDTFSFTVKCEGVLYRFIDRDEQLVIPISTTSLAVESLQQDGEAFRWETSLLLPSDVFLLPHHCYPVEWSSVTCSWNRDVLHRNQNMMNCFLATAPLEFVAVGILGKLLKYLRGNAFLLVVTDRYSKLVCTITLKNITAATVAEVSVLHWYLSIFLLFACCRITVKH